MIDPWGLARILGIHSNVAPNAGFTSGHAWISFQDTDTGAFQTYGLWPDAHPNTIDNGPGEDIRTGMENNAIPQHSRYYELTSEQVTRLGYILAESDTWSYTNTCAGWASDVGRRVTGEDVDADDWFGFETPREISRSLKRLEGRRSTSPSNPLPSPRPKRSSW